MRNAGVPRDMPAGEICLPFGKRDMPLRGVEGGAEGCGAALRV